MQRALIGPLNIVTRVLLYMARRQLHIATQFTLIHGYVDKSYKTPFHIFAKYASILICYMLKQTGNSGDYTSQARDIWLVQISNRSIHFYKKYKIINSVSAFALMGF